ncbi:hypothetical protein A2U01_0051581, partial [Trifolium medium]|nr:hypothetical protein [Trifolium medium]
MWAVRYYVLFVIMMEKTICMFFFSAQQREIAGRQQAL